MTAREFRAIALSLPRASPGAHMGHPDFRPTTCSCAPSRRRSRRWRALGVARALRTFACGRRARTPFARRWPSRGAAGPRSVSPVRRGWR